MVVTSIIQYFREIGIFNFNKFLHKRNAPSEFNQKYQERIQITWILTVRGALIRILQPLKTS